MAQEALFAAVYDVETEVDGSKKIVLTTTSWEAAVFRAKDEVRHNTGSYYAKARIKNAGVVLEEFSGPPKFTSFKGD